MTDRLEKAAAHATTQIADLVKHAETLSAADQNELAVRFEALANDLRWEQLLDDPTRATAVDSLADQALAEFAAGDMHPLDSIFEQRAAQHLQHPEVAAGYGEMETELRIVRRLDALP